MRVEFFGQSQRDDDNREANTSRLVNFYREPVGGVAGFALKSVLGTEAFASLQLFGRDLVEVNGLLYAMAGDTLYRVREDGATTALATTVSKEGARIFGAEQGRVCTVTDGRFFVWDGSTMDEPTGGAFSAFGSGVFFGNYVVLSEDGGRRVLWSDLANAKSLPALNFKTAESTDTDVLQLAKVNGRLWVMKSDVCEVWYVTGQAGANAFATLTGGVIEPGLKARGLVANFEGGLFFVGSDDIAYITAGGAVQPISPPAVNTAIAQSTPTHCFSYQDEGHKFCVIRFADRPAWVYDIVTGEWHERASGENGPWTLTAAGRAFGNWYGTGVAGDVVKFTRNNLDGTDSLVRTADSATIYQERPFRVPLLEIGGRVGLGVTHAADAAADAPLVSLSTSDDGGRTWSLPITRSMGALGDFDRLMEFRRLGRFERGFTARVRVSAPVDATLQARANLVAA